VARLTCQHHAGRLCDEMKKDGIEIFTVGFFVEEDRAKAVLGACASPDKGRSPTTDTSSGERLVGIPGNSTQIEPAMRIE
jgi:hypothetical protein